VALLRLRCKMSRHKQFEPERTDAWLPRDVPCREGEILLRLDPYLGPSSDTTQYLHLSFSAFPFFSFEFNIHLIHISLVMADTSQPSVYHLAAVLSEGFAALSDEYHLLSDQQRQLESKLSFAKQQVCLSSIPHSSLS
jgi:hypothetical protein